MINSDTYDIVITRDRGERIFLAEYHDRLALPQTSVPRFQRSTLHITEFIKAQWGIATVCLVERSSAGEATRPMAVLEWVGNVGCPNAPGHWVSSKHVEAVLPKGEASIVASLLAKLGQAGVATETFCQPGWMAEITSWIDHAIKPQGMHLTGSFRQLGIGPTYVLIRFDTNRGAVWFKANGENTREFNISVRLNAEAPEFFPKLIASREEWRAWLMFEASGSTLDDIVDTAAWLAVARDLAGLQTRFWGRDETLLREGCVDWRGHTVLQTIPAFFYSLGEIMRRQPVASASLPLSDSDLEGLQAKLLNVCDCFYSGQTVACLNNLDFNTSNILRTRERTTFLDWSEAALAHPFITLEFLIANLQKAQPTLGSSIGPCREAYLSALREIHSIGDCVAEWRLARIIAALVYALHSWTTAQKADTDLIDPLIRSLARRMLRDIAALPNGKDL